MIELQPENNTAYSTKIPKSVCESLWS